MLKRPFLVLMTLTLALAGVSATAHARQQIRVVGSSTVYPFTTAVAETFARANAKFRAPIVEATGTGGGLKLFCGGVGVQHPDIVNASRRIKASELAQCQKNGVNRIIELTVGYDGLAVAHAKNAPNFGLTRRDLYLALAATLPNGRKNTNTTWRQVNPRLPNDKIEVLGPPPTSGTRDSFNEMFIEAGCNTFPEMKKLKDTDADKHKTLCTKLREDGYYVEAGENDNLIVQKLVANPKAVGVFGYSFLEENLSKLKDVAIDGVEANYDTISSGKYPGARPMYIYIKSQHIGVVPGIREFLREYSKEATWGPEGYLADRGLVASPAPQRKANAMIARNLTPLNPKTVK
jgi:phosphate transport system substrate-binding protein